MKKSQEHKKKISEGLRKYWEKAKTPRKRCPVCSVEISSWAKRCRKHRIITKEHRKRLSEALTGKKQSEEVIEKLRKVRVGKKAWNKGKVMPRGEKANNWKGGLSKIASRERGMIEMKLWREAVFIRDNYTCQDCGERGRRLNAHHIKPFAKHKEIRTEISNGVTLCEKCHRERHKKKPYAIRSSSIPREERGEVQPLHLEAYDIEGASGDQEEAA